MTPEISRTISRALAVLMAASAASCALTPCNGASKHAHSDRATSHRSFDDVEYWQTVFDAPERAAWQKPAEVVAALNLKPGQRVADLGAGTGYFLAHLANAVGRKGKVLALEVEPTLVEHLRQRAAREQVPQVDVVLTPKDRPALPHHGVDLVFIADTFHHLDHRQRYLAEMRELLPPLGRVAIIDWMKKPLPEGPPPDHKLSRERVVGEMTGAGFELVESPDFLPYQYFLIFRKVAGRTW